MPEDQIRRRSQREIREGKAPRCLVEREMFEPRHQIRAHGSGAYLTRQLVLAAAVLFLVIASTVVHSAGDDRVACPAWMVMKS